MLVGTFLERLTQIQPKFELVLQRGVKKLGQKILL